MKRVNLQHVCSQDDLIRVHVHVYVSHCPGSCMCFETISSIVFEAI